MNHFICFVVRILLFKQRGSYVLKGLKKVFHTWKWYKCDWEEDRSAFVRVLWYCINADNLLHFSMLQLRLRENILISEIKNCLCINTVFNIPAVNQIVNIVYLDSKVFYQLNLAET
jgi:hypothetical protein